MFNFCGKILLKHKKFIAFCRTGSRWLTLNQSYDTFANTFSRECNGKFQILRDNRSNKRFSSASNANIISVFTVTSPLTWESSFRVVQFSTFCINFRVHREIIRKTETELEIGHTLSPHFLYSKIWVTSTKGRKKKENFH